MEEMYGILSIQFTKLMSDMFIHLSKQPLFTYLILLVKRAKGTTASFNVPPEGSA